MLNRIELNADVGKDEWERERFRRLAVVLQWIQVGELARRHCEDLELPKGLPPWSGLIGFRGVLAHSLEDEIDFERVRVFCGDDLRSYRETISVITDRNS